MKVIWVFLWYFIPPDSECFIWLDQDGVPARRRAARHPTILYHSSITYHTIGCRSRTIPPLFCSLKLNHSRNKQKKKTERGRFHSQLIFSSPSCLLSVVFLISFSENSSVFTLNPNLLWPWKSLFWLNCPHLNKDTWMLQSARSLPRSDQPLLNNIFFTMTTQLSLFSEDIHLNDVLFLCIWNLGTIQAS